MPADKSLTAALRAPFFKRHLGRTDAATAVDYAYDNGFIMRWRNAADTADIDVLKVDSSNNVVFPSGLVFGDAVTDALILTGRSATGTISGTALNISASYL